MKTVQRKNKQLRVEDDRVNAMLAEGFVEIDEKTGKPVAAPVAAVDVSAVKKENAALKKENKALKAQAADLLSQLEALQKAD